MICAAAIAMHGASCVLACCYRIACTVKCASFSNSQTDQLSKTQFLSELTTQLLSRSEWAAAYCKKLITAKTVLAERALVAGCARAPLLLNVPLQCSNCQIGV